MTTAKQETRGALPASVIAEILAVGVLLALSACAVGPKFTKPETKPSETWSTKSDPQISTESAVNPAWWQVFSDPALNRLVELAYQQNLPLQVAGLRIVEARAQLGIATGSQYPQLQVVFGQAEAVGLSNNTANSPLTLAGSLPPGTSLSESR